MHTRSKDTEPELYYEEIDRRFHRLRRFVKESLETRDKMAEEEQKALRDYAMPLVTEIQSSIQRPAIQATTFEIKPGTIQMIQNTVQFGGLPNDDPSEHLVSFIEICDTFKYHGVSEDAIRLRLFPFTLRDKAKRWLHSLPQGSITTWEDLAQKFLAKFFPPAKTSKLRNDITSFTQLDQESLYEAWERFKDLLRKCPHHGIPKWLLVQTFYNGLSSMTRTSIDAAAGGALMGKNYDDAYELLETMAANNYQWPSARTARPKVAGMHDLDVITSLAAQVASLSKKIDSMAVQPVQSASLVCELCAGNHASESCAINAESVQYVGNFNRQPQQNISNNYNPGWRNHPNFSWKDNQNQFQVPRPQAPPGFHNQSHPLPDKQLNLEDMLAKFMSGTEARMQAQDKIMNQMDMSMKNQSVAIKSLENQMGQLASAVNSRPQGQLPSDTEINPRREGKEHCKAIELRSGRELPDVVEKNLTSHTQKSKTNVNVSEEGTGDEIKGESKVEKSVEVEQRVPSVPFPQ